MRAAHGKATSALMGDTLESELVIYDDHEVKDAMDEMKDDAQVQEENKLNGVNDDSDDDTSDVDQDVDEFGFADISFRPESSSSSSRSKDTRASSGGGATHSTLITFSLSLTHSQLSHLSCLLPVGVEG